VPKGVKQGNGLRSHVPKGVKQGNGLRSHVPKGDKQGNGLRSHVPERNKIIIMSLFSFLCSDLQNFIYIYCLSDFDIRLLNSHLTSSNLSFFNSMQIYHVWEGYLRKLPVERRNIFRAEWGGKFSLNTGIFRKYPSQTWYICLITPNII
jgi:hypothetical protein